MKLLSIFLLFAAGLAAQCPPVPSTQYPALESILNDKPCMSGGGYLNPTWITGLAYAKITGVPAFEPPVSAGTASQFYRGDKTWQTLNAAAVANAVDATGNYSNPVWITSFGWAKLTGVPSFEPSVAAGTASQYYRGDKTWQTFPAFEPPITAGTTLQYLRGDKSLATFPTTLFPGIVTGSTVTFNSGLSSVVVGTPSPTGVAVDQAASISTGSVLSAPTYWYQAPSFRAGRVAISKASVIVNGNGLLAPTALVIIGDSIIGFQDGALRRTAAQYGGNNGIGWVPFYSNIWGSDFTTFTVSAGFVATRDDPSSADAWGPAGSRVDGGVGESITLQPSTAFPFDSLRLWYGKAAGRGTFNYTVDGGAPVSVDTSLGGVTALGIAPVTGLTGGGNVTHTVVITVTSGSVRLYGADFYEKGMAGLELHVLQSGGSQAAQWNGNVAYTAQYIATVNPVAVVVWLGANDAGTAFAPAATFSGYMTGIIGGLSIPSTTATVVMTNTPRGTDNTGPEDTAFLSLVQQYRTTILSLAATNNWSVFDLQSFWPAYPAAWAAGMYSDIIHPSAYGAAYTYSGLMRNLFPVSDTQIADPSVVAFRRASVLLAQNGVSCFGSYFVAGTGAATDQGTGFCFATNGVMQLKIQNAVVAQYGNDGLANTIVGYFPTAGTPNVVSSFRQGSTAANAFRLSVTSANDTLLALNNAWLRITTTAGKGMIIGSTATDTGSGAIIQTAGTIQLSAGAVTAQPACDSFHAGVLYYSGHTAGVKDTAAICAADATNTYAWRTIY